MVNMNRLKHMLYSPEILKFTKLNKILQVKLIVTVSQMSNLPSRLKVDKPKKSTSYLTLNLFDSPCFANVKSPLKVLSEPKNGLYEVALNDIL